MYSVIIIYSSSPSIHRIALVLSVTSISCVPCCFVSHEKENKTCYYSVNLPDKGIKGNKKLHSFFLSFFLFFVFILFIYLFIYLFIFFFDIRHLIKSSSLHQNSTYYNESVTVFVKFT